MRLAPVALLLATLVGGASAQNLPITVNFAEDLPDAFTNDFKADADPVASGDQISLRAAVMLANKQEGEDTIIVPDGLWKLTRQGAEEEAAVTGDLDIAEDLVIQGTAADPEAKTDGTILDGKKLKDRLFEVGPGVTLTLQGLTLRNGKAIVDQSGGAVRVIGSLVMEQCVVRNCKAPVDGGAIDMNLLANNLTLDEVLFFKNDAGEDGGAIDVEGGVISISRTTFQKNHADVEGGALRVSGSIAEMTNVTFSANSAAQDGGAMAVRDGGVLSLTNVTSFANACKETAGIAAQQTGQSNTVLLRNTVLDDKGDRNASGNITSLGGNVDSGTSCKFQVGDSLSDVKIKLLKLKNYGGFTPTHALADDSPAIDLAGYQGCPETDQRGVPRVDIEGVGGPFLPCDAGAFEFTAEP